MQVMCCVLICISPPVAADRARVFKNTTGEVLWDISGNTLHSFRGGTVCFLEGPHPSTAPLYLLRSCPGTTCKLWTAVEKLYYSKQSQQHSCFYCVQFAVCEFWVSDRVGPSENAVWQPDSRRSFRLWRLGSLLCHSGLPASGHTADTLCSSGRTQGGTNHFLSWSLSMFDRISYISSLYRFLFYSPTFKKLGALWKM